MYNKRLKGFLRPFRAAIVGYMVSDKKVAGHADARQRGSSGGYDLLGNIAEIEPRPGATAAETRRFAEQVMERHKMTTTVLAKSGPVSGVFRTRSFSYVSGKRTFIAVYRESGCTFRFDVRRVFFSNRLAYERSRISSLVRPGETIAVPFAGVGPFPIVIAKNSKPSSIVAIELNKAAADYMEKNIKLNKLSNITAVHDDVRNAAKRYKGFADRVIMQMPTQSLEFLDEMVTMAKSTAIAHIYVFCDSDTGIRDAKKRISKFMKENGYSVRYISSRAARTYSRDEIEAVIDLKFSKKSKRTQH